MKAALPNAGGAALFFMREECRDHHSRRWKCGITSCTRLTTKGGVRYKAMLSRYGASLRHGWGLPKTHIGARRVLTQSPAALERLT